MIKKIFLVIPLFLFASFSWAQECNDCGYVAGRVTQVREGGPIDENADYKFLYIRDRRIGHVVMRVPDNQTGVNFLNKVIFAEGEFIDVDMDYLNERIKCLFGKPYDEWSEEELEEMDRIIPISNALNNGIRRNRGNNRYYRADIIKIIK